MIAKLIGRTGTVSGKDFVLHDTSRLGAGPESEVQIRSEGVSRSHARLWREGDAYWLEDAGSTNGTFLNGRRIQRDRIRHLDVVTLGRHVDLIFLCKAGDAPVAASPGVLEASLEATDGPDAGTSLDIPKGEITLGRASSCNVVVDSAAVSKVHARIQRSADQVAIQDLGSVNGTFVNGKRIVSITVLAPRDRIGLGGVRSFVVKISRDPAAAPISKDSTTSVGPVFDQEWKTRLVWSAEELAELQAAAQQVVAPAPIVAAAKPAAPARPAAPPKAAAAAEQKPAAAGPAKPPAAKAPAPPAAAAPPKAAAPAAPPAGAEPKAAPPEPKPAPPEPKPAAAAPPKASAPQPAAPAPPQAAAALPAGADKPAAPPAPRAASAAAPAPKAAPEKPAAPAAAAATPGPPPAAARPSAEIDGSTVLVGGRAPREAAEAPIKGVRLQGSAGTFSVEHGSFVIGRAPDARIRIDTRELSRVHALVVVTPLTVTIEDQKSANGTFVNDVEISAKQELRHGDRIMVSNLEFTVEIVR